MNLQEQVIQRMGEMGGRLRVKSALNPVLWLCGLVTIPSICLMGRFNYNPVWLIVIAVTPVVCAAFGFIFLLFVDRDKLQSEDYQIRKQTLELIQEKGDKFPVLGTSIQAIANPDSPKLASDLEEVN